LHRQQLREIDNSFGALLKQLPNKSQMDALLVDINQAGLGRGLQFELFKPAPKETVRDFYAELPVSVRVTGGYHDMGQFASDIAQLSRIVTLNDIVISPTGKDGGALAMETTAKTFRYLDEEEVAKQKKAAAAAKNPKAAAAKK
jgi:type IV pilus assembly protein PilO